MLRAYHVIHLVLWLQLHEGIAIHTIILRLGLVSRVKARISRVSWVNRVNARVGKFGVRVGLGLGLLQSVRT